MFNVLEMLLNCGGVNANIVKETYSAYEPCFRQYHRKELVIYSRAILVPKTENSILKVSDRGGKGRLVAILFGEWYTPISTQGINVAEKLPSPQ